MNRLRNRLILVFVVATLLPLGLTLWTTLSLLELSLGWRRSPSWTRSRNRSKEPGASCTTNRAKRCGAMRRRGGSRRGI